VEGKSRGTQLIKSDTVLVLGGLDFQKTMPFSARKQQSPRSGLASWTGGFLGAGAPRQGTQEQPLFFPWSPACNVMQPRETVSVHHPMFSMQPLCLGIQEVGLLASLSCVFGLHPPLFEAST